MFIRLSQGLKASYHYFLYIMQHKNQLFPQTSFFQYLKEIQSTYQDPRHMNKI